MLIEGECEGLGPVQAAKKFGYTRQRYFQIRAVFLEQGAVERVWRPQLRPYLVQAGFPRVATIGG